jgi:hypothetical protein
MRPSRRIAHELTENLRQNLSVDWSERESVRAKLRLMVKRILRKYKYPPDLQDAAVELVLQQAQVPKALVGRAYTLPSGRRRTTNTHWNTATPS